MSVAPPALHLAPSFPEDADLPIENGGKWAPTLGAVAAAVIGLGVGLGYAQYVLVAALALALAVVSFRTERGILYVLVLVPFGESLSLGPVTVGRLLAAVSVLVLAGKLITGQLRPPGFRGLVWLPTAGFMAIVVASGLWAPDFDGWSFAIGQAALAVAFGLAYALLVDDPAQIGALLRVYVVGAVVASGIGFVQALTDVRAEGLQGDANIYALYQVAALPAALALARISRSGGARLLWILATLPILGSVFASQSRGALMALVATSLVLAALHERRRLLVPLVLGAGVLAYNLAPLIDDRYAVQRVSSDRASGRIDIWFTAWQAFLENPWTGIGAGNFVSQSIARLTTEPGVELVKSHLLTGEGIEVHNIYLESLAERGVFGFLTLLLLLGATLWCLRLAARRFPDPVVTALAPMLVTYCVASVFLSVSNSKLLWMLIGLAAALLAIPSEDRSSAPSIHALRSTR